MTLDPSKIVSGFWTSATPDGYSQSVQFLASGCGARHPPARRER